MKCISIDFIGAYKISRTKRMEGVFSRCIVRLFNRKTWLSRVKRNQTTQGEKKKEKKTDQEAVYNCRAVELLFMFRVAALYFVLSGDSYENISGITVKTAHQSCCLSVRCPFKAHTPQWQKEKEKQAGSGIESYFSPPSRQFFFFSNATLHDLQKNKKIKNKYLEILLVCKLGGKHKIQHKQRNRLYLRADREWSFAIIQVVFLPDGHSDPPRKSAPKAVVPCFLNKECRRDEGDRLITFGLNYQFKGLADEHRCFHFAALWFD